MQDSVFWKALGHSFIYLIVTPVLIVLSIVLAIIVNRKLPGIQRLSRAVLYSRHQRQHCRGHCLEVDAGYEWLITAAALAGFSQRADPMAG